MFMRKSHQNWIHLFGKLTWAQWKAAWWPFVRDSVTAHWIVVRGSSTEDVFTTQYWCHGCFNILYNLIYYGAATPCLG